MSILRCALMCLPLLLPEFAAAALLVNGGFEISESTTGFGPTGFGDWEHDESSIVSAENGVIPFSGNQMLKFIGTNPNGAITGSGSEVWQFVDASSIPAGSRVGLTGYFNRVEGDSQTDTVALIRVSAHSGNPTNFFNTPNPPVIRSETFLFSDSDASTWEKLSIEPLEVPANTDYLAVLVVASENVFNDSSSPEFDGHYIDAVSLFVVPEPASALLIGVLLASMSLRRKS